jgi:FtsZ-interacting cell division protein ZipA
MIKLNKTLKIGSIILGAIAVTALTIWGAIWVSHIESNKAAAAYPKCQGQHETHDVTIRNDKVTPQHTSSKRCDTLTIINFDNQDRIIAFGQHEHHTAYDGITERYLNYQGKFSVTLVQPGNFRFHDHEQDEVQGTFTVSAAQ